MAKVLFDHNMPPAIARALNELICLDGHSAFALKDRFPRNIGDIEYFAELAKENDWIVISKDLANAKRKPEKAAILKSGVVAFYLAKSVQKQKINEQAATILWQWDKILQQRQINAFGLFELPTGKRTGFRPLA